MNLKKNITFGIAAGFFAVATVFNMSMLNEINAGDFSLDAISIMAQAQDAEETDGVEERVPWDNSSTNYETYTKEDGTKMRCKILIKDKGLNCNGKGSISCEAYSSYLYYKSCSPVEAD